MVKEKEQLYQAIGKIAWGYIFLHFDFNLGTIDILPGWVGMIFIINAIRKAVIVEEPSAKLIMPLGTLLCLDDFVGWICKIFSLSFDIYIYTLVITVISLYFHFQLLTNLACIAKRYECKEEQELLNLRTINTVLTTVQVFLLQLGNEKLLVWLAIAQIVVCIWICKVLFHFRKSFLANVENWSISV